MSMTLTDAQVLRIRKALNSAVLLNDRLANALFQTQVALKEQIAENYIMMKQLNDIDIERMKRDHEKK